MDRVGEDASLLPSPGNHLLTATLLGNLSALRPQATLLVAIWELSGDREPGGQLT